MTDMLTRSPENQQQEQPTKKGFGERLLSLFTRGREARAAAKTAEANDIADKVTDQYNTPNSDFNLANLGASHQDQLAQNAKDAGNEVGAEQYTDMATRVRKIGQASVEKDLQSGETATKKDAMDVLRDRAIEDAKADDVDLDLMPKDSKK